MECAVKVITKLYTKNTSLTKAVMRYCDGKRSNSDVTWSKCNQSPSLTVQGNNLRGRIKESVHVRNRSLLVVMCSVVLYRELFGLVRSITETYEANIQKHFPLSPQLFPKVTETLSRVPIQLILEKSCYSLSLESWKRLKRKPLNFFWPFRLKN